MKTTPTTTTTVWWRCDDRGGGGNDVYGVMTDGDAGGRERESSDGRETRWETEAVWVMLGRHLGRGWHTSDQGWSQLPVTRSGFPGLSDKSSLIISLIMDISANASWGKRLPPSLALALPRLNELASSALLQIDLVPNIHNTNIVSVKGHCCLAIILFSSTNEPIGDETGLPPLEYLHQRPR